MRGVRESQPEEIPDFFLRDAPMQILTAPAYFMVKNMKNWGAPIDLHPWDTWDKLADRLEGRLGYHIWHPWHWQECAVTPSGSVRLRAWEDSHQP